MKFLQENDDFDVVYGNGVYCDIEGKPIRKFSENRINHVSGDVYGVLITSSFFGTGGNVMVRSKTIHEHSLRYDETIVWCQDYDFYVRLSIEARFGLVEEDLIFYRLHDGNMTASMPTGKRVDHLVRMKMKILSSTRFSELPETQKVQFFYDMLNNVLVNRLEDQQSLFQQPAFRQLSVPKQATLLRWSANHYLAKGTHSDIAKDWVKRAFSLAPLDIKTLGVFLATQLNVHLFSAVMKSLKNRS